MKMANGGNITKKASGGKQSIPAGRYYLSISRVFFICDEIFVLFIVAIIGLLLLYLPLFATKKGLG